MDRALRLAEDGWQGHFRERFKPVKWSEEEWDLGTRRLAGVWVGEGLRRLLRVHKAPMAVM